jgi:hypothetical protein
MNAQEIIESALITRSHELEVGNNQSMCEIRFDCIVRMFDCGFKEMKRGLFESQKRSLQPQWFKLENKLTLEFLKNSSDMEVGYAIKQMFKNLTDHIEKHKQ